MPIQLQPAFLASAGVCLYLIGFCFAWPWDIPLALLALAGFACAAQDADYRPLLKSPIAWALGGFLLAGLASILLSEDPDRSWRMSRLFLPALLIFLLIAQFFDLDGLRRLCRALTLVVLGLSLALLWTAWNHAGLVPTRWVKALGSPVLVEPNDIALVPVILPFSLALLVLEARLWIKILAGLATLLGAVTVFLLKSRLAVLAELVAMAAMVAAWRPRLALWLGGGAAALVLAVDAWLGFPLIAKHGFALDTRLPLWLAAWRMFVDAPLLGHGPRTFVLFYQDYLNAAPVPAWLPPTERVAPWAHNLYLEMLAEQGILGLLALLGLGFVAAFSAGRIMRIGQGSIRIFAAAVLASLAAFGVAGILELSLIRQWVAVMLFLLAGITYLMTRCNGD
jgi:O-antigen ligase